MTDLLHIIPSFPLQSYTHLLPSLEKHLITTTDLLTLDALEIAKRAHLPLLDVRRLAAHVVRILQGQLGLVAQDDEGRWSDVDVGKGDVEGMGGLRKSGKEVVATWSVISTLDDELDEALGGGIPTGYITEITGESGVGKTQFLLTLLLSAQLPPPQGLSCPTLYISTEAPLHTQRLTQLLKTHPRLVSSPASLSRIITIQTQDLESQDHIITYQLPIALSRHNIALCIIDSVAANFRAEHLESTQSNSPSALAHRSAQLVRLGAHLRSLARVYNCAIVVANQVGDRFAPIQLTPPNPLSLDHQQRFFTGWGAHPSAPISNLKTPSLGLAWTNQIACRIALIKESRVETYDVPHLQAGAVQGKEEDEGIGRGGEEWSPKRWRRWMRVVFAPWVKGTGDAEPGVEFEVWAGGVRAVRRGGEGIGGDGTGAGAAVTAGTNPSAPTISNSPTKK